MKNNIDYYQHYANADQHPKFKMLRVSHGWSGEGRFWALNNRIAQADNCCLDISKKYNAASIASDLGLTLQEFHEFIDCLKNDCELIDECEPGVITTEIIQENFQSVSINREKARDRKKRYLEKVSKGSPELSESLPEQNKRVKERKVKERKRKETPRGKIDILKDYLLKIIPDSMKGHVSKITEFYQYRQQKPKAKRYDTEKKLDGLIRDLSNCHAAGYDLDICLDISMERGWQTPSLDYFKPEMFLNGKQIGNIRPTGLSRSEQNALACQQFIEGAGNEK